MSFLLYLTLDIDTMQKKTVFKFLLSVLILNSFIGTAIANVSTKTKLLRVEQIRKQQIVDAAKEVETNAISSKETDENELGLRSVKIDVPDPAPAPYKPIVLWHGMGK